MEDTAEQAAIIAHIEANQGSLLIDALAGSGKTTTLIRALARAPFATTLMCAFNKRIADELQAKVPPLPRGRMVRVQTFHSIGLGLLREHHRVELDKSATEQLVNLVAGNLPFRAKRAAVNLLRTVKETIATPAPPPLPTLEAIGMDYNLTTKLSPKELQLTLEVAHDAYLASLDMRRRTTIDFCDMVWLPVALGLEPKGRYKAVIVDELQDISGPQLALLQRLRAPNGTFIGIGDRRQQIYAWRGSLGGKAWDALTTELHARVLPLTMTWRCAQAVVREANALVPSLRARADAPPGAVQMCAWTALPAALTGGASERARAHEGASTFVLARSNAALLDCALYLWRERVRFELNAGQELLEPLFDLLANRLVLTTPAAFRASLNEWRTAELRRAETAGATAYADRVEEQAAMLEVAVQYAAPAKIKQLLIDILTPNGALVLCSTVHKVKGLEATRVFLLRDTFARHQRRICRVCAGEGARARRTCGTCDGAGVVPVTPSQEELNIEYVAITRAVHTLVWVQPRASLLEVLEEAKRADFDPQGPELAVALAEHAEEEVPYEDEHGVPRSDVEEDAPQ